MELITVNSALKTIFSNVLSSNYETIDIQYALGRVLDEEIINDRPLPPFNRVAMDGIAIHSKDWEKGIRSYPIDGIAQAGSPQNIEPLPIGHSIEVTTGAVLPRYTNTVIRYEDISISQNIATVNLDTLSPKNHVHSLGKDMNQGDFIIHKNTRITANHIAAAATVGHTKIRVTKPPKVLFLSTGNEVIPPENKPLEYQIRSSNAPMALAMLKSIGIQAQSKHLIDKTQVMESEIAQALIVYDIIILSGGVSKGKFDFLPQVLEDLGVQKQFHRIAQKPGKPLWFGTTKDKRAIFGLPGNPQSVYTSMMVYVLPFIKKILKYPTPKFQNAILTEDIHFEPNLTYFALITLQQNANNQLTCTPLKTQGSGDIVSLSLAEGLAVMPACNKLLQKGHSVQILTLF